MMTKYFVGEVKKKDKAKKKRVCCLLDCLINLFNLTKQDIK